MEEEEEGLSVSEPQQVEHTTEDKFVEVVTEPFDAPEFASLPDMDDSELVNGSSYVPEEVAVVSEEVVAVATVEEAMSTEEAEMETELEVAEGGKGGGRRKRGRPNRVLARAPPKKKEEEDVCFICFDGGNLVLCDRRGCPKAYHPSCVNRDEAFFRSKGRWNCGWHICSNCEKAAHFMCYTCTYSLCKGCIKETEFFCVRGNKGLCETCRRTVMLIEKNEGGPKEMVQVDFDDKNSWEYLFKEYWVDLKGKLLLTSDELEQAKNPWKGSGLSVQKVESSDELYDANGDQGSVSDSSSGHLEVSNTKKRKLKKRSKNPKADSIPSETREVGSEGTAVPNGTEWASKELLDLVAHMRNGDKSMLSQFDVQALLLEYIKQNNLRDPRRKSQIVCDTRLENLFGKPRVGHFEMLKLLESHFLLKEETPEDDIQEEMAAVETSPLENDGNIDAHGKIGSDKRRKARKKGEERAPQTNLDDYAAIDVHNINLLYLKRNLMEDLLDDSEKFNDKVIGSFVRIRISGSNQKQDMYRLVQVVGTRKAQQPYKTGKKSTDVLLEILNLNKMEVIPIDTISNQDFTEDECKRLRQSIKCGLIARMTVGEVHEKAVTLQEVRVNDWLETEKLRLSHLRDRASEKGRRKELRECVEKLQLLNTAEERSRRLQDIPDVHADPKMDPSYESDEDDEEQDDKKQDYYARQRESGFSRKVREPISPGRGSSVATRSWNGARKNTTSTWEPGKHLPAKGVWDKVGSGDRIVESSWNEGREMHQSDSGQTVLKSASSISLETAATSFPSGPEPSVNFSEMDKIWHYKDPSGKIQGPFSMAQLRKWSTTGYFPVDLRIWRTSEKQEDSVLLNDALIGKFHKELPKRDSSFTQPPKGTVLSDSNREINWGSGWKENTNSTWTDKYEIDRSWSSTDKDANVPANGTSVLTRSDGRVSVSSGWAVPTPNLKGGQSAYNSHSTPLVHSSHPSSSLSAQPHPASFNQGETQGGVRWNSGQNSGNANNSGNAWNANNSLNLPSPTPMPSNSGWTDQVSEKKWSNASMLSGQPAIVASEASPTMSSNLQHTPFGITGTKNAPAGWNEHHIFDASAHGWNVNSVSGSMSKPSETPAQVNSVDFYDPPSPTPKSNSGGWPGVKGTENRSGMVTGSLQQTSMVSASVPKVGSIVAEQFPPGVNEPPKGAAERGSQFPSTVKPSGGEWVSGVVSPSLLKPAPTISSHTIDPIPESVQLPHTHEILGSISDAPVSLIDQSASAVQSKDDSSLSSNNFTSTLSVKGSAELLPGLKNDPSNTQEVMGPKVDPEMGDVSGVTSNRQTSSKLSSTENPCGFPQDDDEIPQKSPESSSPRGLLVVSLTPADASGNISMETKEHVSSPRESVLASISQGWLPVPSSTAEPSDSSSIPAGVPRISEPVNALHNGSGQSSMHDPAPSGLAHDQSISGLLASTNSAALDKFASVASTNSSSWSTPSAAMPSSWNKSPAPTMNINQNNSSAHPANENPNSGLRGPTENPSVLPPQGNNANMGWGVPPEVNTSLGWAAAAVAVAATAAQTNSGTSQGTMSSKVDGNTGWVMGATNNAAGWGIQQTHVGDRFTGPERGFPSGDGGRGGAGGGSGRPWNRQSSFGSGGSGGRGGFSRGPAKSQRVCKFHESGHCKKGADCDYLHP